MSARIVLALGLIWHWFWSPVPLALNLLTLGLVGLWHIDISIFIRPGSATNGWISLPLDQVYHLGLYTVVIALWAMAHALVGRQA